jgi:hypothetical protein
MNPRTLARLRRLHSYCLARAILAPTGAWQAQWLTRGAWVDRQLPASERLPAVVQQRLVDMICECRDDEALPIAVSELELPGADAAVGPHGRSRRRRGPWPAGAGGLGALKRRHYAMKHILAILLVLLGIQMRSSSLMVGLVLVMLVVIISDVAAGR